MIFWSGRMPGQNLLSQPPKAEIKVFPVSSGNGEKYLANPVNPVYLSQEQDKQGETMAEHDWIEEFPVAITVCDKEGLILEMNEAADTFFKKDGGRKLIGTNALDCHPEKAREKFEGMMKGVETNVYSIEKRGIHRLIYQTPWYKDGKVAGFIELALPIPARIPHFVRGSIKTFFCHRRIRDRVAAICRHLNCQALRAKRIV